MLVNENVNSLEEGRTDENLSHINSGTVPVLLKSVGSALDSRRFCTTPSGAGGRTSCCR